MAASPTDIIGVTVNLRREELIYSTVPIKAFGRDLNRLSPYLTRYRKRRYMHASLELDAQINYKFACS